MGAALVACLLWGGADFLAATGARTRSAAAVQLIVQASGLVALVLPLPWLLADLGRVTTTMALWAGGAGLVDTVGYLCLYLAMSRGQIGTVAPVAGLGVLVPVLADLGWGRPPGVLAGVGVVTAIVGVALLSATGQTRGCAGLGLAVVAAAAFGCGFVCVARSASVDVLATPTLMRLVSVPAAWVLMLLRRRPPGSEPAPVRRPWSTGALALAGLAEAGGNLAFGAGSTLAPVSLVSVTASMYPLVTVLLARLVLAERLTGRTRLGACTCLLATGCLALAG